MHKFWESIYCNNYITGYNPFLLKNMNKAIENMAFAINNRRKIIVYGIPTVDGICAVASLCLVLKYLNADVEYILSDKNETGYSINKDDIVNEIDFLGADLLVAVGLDVYSEEDISLLRDLDINLIVLENKKTINEKKYVYINPSQKGSQYRFKDLSISALSFKLMQAVAIYYNLKNINKYLDIIILGSKWAKVISKGENGIFIKEGKLCLQNTNNCGLMVIMDKYKINEVNENNILKIIEIITPTGKTVGVENNARIVLELLITNDKDRASQISKYLHNLKKSPEIKYL